MSKNLGLQQRLTVSFTAIAVFSMTVCGLVSFYFSSNIVRTLTVENLNAQIHSIESTVDISIKEALGRENRTMDYWAKNAATKIAFNGNSFTVEGRNQDQHEFVDKIGAEIAGAVTVFAKTPEGYKRLSTNLKQTNGPRAVGTYLTTDSPQVLALNEGKRYVGRAQVLGKAFITAYEPLFQQGKVVGAFFIGHEDLSEQAIKEYLSKQKLLQTGYFYVLDHTGKFLVHPTKAGQDSISILDLDGRAIFKEILEKKSGSVEYSWLNAEVNQAQSKMAIFSYLPQYDWIVAASLNKAEVDASVKQLRFILICISLIMTLLMVFSTYVFGKKIASRLGSISENLAASSNQVSRSSSELASASEMLAQANLEQAASLQETVSAMEEISSMVVRNLENTQSTEAQAQQMDHEAKNGKSILEDLTLRVNESGQLNREIKNEISLSHSEMRSIIALIIGIEDKTKVINDIVFQTRLLSFNASVEAARAGDHGKGFAVVAEEVRSLASMSGAAAQDINDSLDSSRLKIEGIISSIEKKTDLLLNRSSDQIGACIQVSGNCQSVFESLLSRMTSVNESVAEIAMASKEQTLGISEIKKAMNELDKVTQQNSGTANQVSMLSQNLAGNSQEMENAVFLLEETITGSSDAATAHGNQVASAKTAHRPGANISKSDQRAA